MVTAMETNNPVETKKVIAALLLEKKADLLKLIDRINATTDDVELMRLSAQRELLSQEIRLLLKRGRALIGS